MSRERYGFRHEAYNSGIFGFVSILLLEASMLLSFALILIAGWLAGRLCTLIKLPALLGMIIVGIVLSPSVLNLIDPMTLALSGDLRKIALIIILSRAGLSLRIADLIQLRRPAILLSFVPATLEIIGIIILAPLLLGFTWQEAALLGSILAAVSPAVIVPKMIQVMQEGYGQRQRVPQLILSGASIDDIYVIVVFYAFLEIARAGVVPLNSFWIIPLKIVLGIIVGAILGWLFAQLSIFQNWIPIHETMLYLSICFLIVYLEEVTTLPFSGLLAVMISGVFYKRFSSRKATSTEHHYNQLWQVAQIGLFVLVGINVDYQYLKQASLLSLVLIIGGLIFRTVGTWLSLLKSQLSHQERQFVMLSYIPKATVQASIGGIPLALGISSGEEILVIAVLAILFTAPLGALLIDLTYQKLLSKEEIS